MSAPADAEAVKVGSDAKLLQLRFDLVARALAAQPQRQQGLEEFGRLLREDFLAFVSAVPSVGSPAESILKLQDIERRLELLALFPVYRDKTIVAVAGGFSSGKSSFITSFFEDKALRLPIGIEPVTAIPSYVVAGTANSIKGHTHKGGVIDISATVYQMFSHEFVKSFGFDLRDIIPHIAIETPLRGLSHLSFIDLPGFDAAGGDGYTEQDQVTAREYVAQADAAIWVVGLDANGTIPLSDLAFLRTLSDEGKAIFLVGNKADLRFENDIAQILDNFRDTLDADGIVYSGIAAYSASEGKQYRYRRKSLSAFLNSLDVVADPKKYLVNELNRLFSGYYRELKKKSEARINGRKALKSFALDLTELGLFDEQSKFQPPKPRPSAEPRQANVSKSAVWPFRGHREPERQDGPEFPEVDTARLQRASRRRDLISERAQQFLRELKSSPVEVNESVWLEDAKRICASMRKAISDV